MIVILGCDNSFGAAELVQVEVPDGATEEDVLLIASDAAFQYGYDNARLFFYREDYSAEQWNKLLAASYTLPSAKED